MEVTPSISINPATGEEFIDYDNAVVIDNSYRNDVQREFRELEQQSYYEDEEGIHSRFADELEDEYEEVEEEYEDDDSVDESFMNSLYEATGGEEHFQDILQWANENLSEEFIEAYDELIESNQQEQCLYAINKLFDLYNTYN